MKKYLITLIAGSVILGACSKGDNQKSLSDASSPQQIQQALQAKQSQNAPQGDKTLSLDAYKPITSGTQLTFAYMALVPPPVDYGKIANAVSNEYRYQNDEFKKKDVLASLIPGIDKKISEAKQNPYYSIEVTSGNVLSPYNFTAKTFSVLSFANGSGDYYMNDNSLYRLGFSNAESYRTVPVANEEVARKLETLRATNGLRLTAYFFANDIELGQTKVNAQIMRLRITDNRGNTLIEF